MEAQEGEQTIRERILMIAYDQFHAAAEEAGVGNLIFSGVARPTQR